MTRPEPTVPRALTPRPRTRTVLGTVVIVGSLLMTMPGTAAAVPPPPPNPSDSQLDVASSSADAQAGTVGALITQLTSAQNQLTQLRNDVELKMELANKALVDLQTAQDKAAAAHAAKAAADRQVAVAGQNIEAANKQVDAFAAGSYQQGSTVGGLSAYLGSASPGDVLARAQLLDAVSGSQLSVLKGLQRARATESNAASAAKAAQLDADAAEAAATEAKSAADAARATAQAAQAAQAAQTIQLQAQEAAAQTQLDAARANVNGLQGQRAAFEAWDNQRRAEEAAAAAAAAEQQRQAAAAEQQRQADAAAAAAAGRSRSSSGGGGGSGGGSSGGGDSSGGGGDSAPVGSSVAAVIARAESQLGVRYSWGGGNRYGPTVGIRDGGVADTYGDYQSVGFDCSGLMIYAFAGVQSLPHYAGYQYNAGRQVPRSQMQPGDMIFYGNSGIHHVSMYIGNGQMIEAPYSGSQVRISAVYYSDMLPYVTRLIG